MLAYTSITARLHIYIQCSTSQWGIIFLAVVSQILMTINRIHLQFECALIYIECHYLSVKLKHTIIEVFLSAYKHLK